jgi:F-type H+-transporting ATPase subunit beta
MEALPAPQREVATLAIDNPVDPSSPEVLAAAPLLDARTFLSSTLAKSGIYPAIDPLPSTSRLMDPAIVGREHYDTARAVRHVLRTARDLLEGGEDGRERPFSAADRLVMARARKLQRFFTQPFAVAEAFTGRRGQVVPLAETIRGCQAVLAGAYDGVEDDALMWRGSIDEPAQRTA